MVSEGFWKRYRGIICFFLITAVLVWLFYYLRTVVFPFLIGWLIAYLVHPFLSWAEPKIPLKGRLRSLRRPLLILFLFILAIILAVILLSYILSAVIGAGGTLAVNFPKYFRESTDQIRIWLSDFEKQIPADVINQYHDLTNQAGASLAGAARDSIGSSAALIPQNSSLIIGFLSLPIFIFFLLMEWEKLSESFYKQFSARTVTHAHNIVGIIGKTLGQYTRAAVTLALVLLLTCLIGFTVMGINYAPALAVLIGITDLIPLLGAWIGLGVAVIITLATTPEKTVWVILLFFGAKLLEDQVVGPKVQGTFLSINPALVILLLGIGAFVAGFWGLILIVPLTATVYDVFNYIRNIPAEGG